MKVATSQEMKDLDRAAMEEFGIPGLVLMENAALRAVQVLREKHNHLLSERVFIFCGKGNNGGDGLAMARHLANSGHRVEIILLTDPEKVGGDAAVNLRICRKMGLSLRSVLSTADLSPLRDSLSGGGLIIDAIFGTGLASAVSGFYGEAIELINSLPNPVLSVDIPSGLNADTGMVEGPCVQADVTIAFGLPKRAHYVTPASNFAGFVEVVDISLPAALIRNMDCSVETLEREAVAALPANRKADAHKGNFGHLVVIGGSTGKGGAPALAALAGLRVGTGLVTIAVPEGVQRAIEIEPLETMSLPLAETKEGIIAESACETLIPFLRDKDAVVIGPGMGTHPETLKFFKNILGAISCPLVVDADGLNLLPMDKAILEGKKGPVILTPHPGEMSRLMGVPTQEVQARRLESAQKFAQKTGCFVVLKGAGTIIAAPGGKAYINTTGNPGMATAGTGDVLAGMIGGFLAQVHPPQDAAALGVFLHGLAGDMTAEKKGEASLIAGDLIEALPAAFRKLRGNSSD